MKRVISIFLILVILSTIFAICTSAFADGGFTYTTSGSTAKITGWEGTSGSVTIPEKINSTYNVTQIGDYAFADKPGITSVTFNGSNLTTIGEGAFSTNNKCTSLTIPASVTTIKARAFHAWVALSRLTFASGSKITTIGNWAFRSAQSLSRITFPDKESGSISIGEGAFSYCSSLAAVDFPKCVSAIGEESFIGCINLASVTIRKENASIGNNAFDLTASTGRNRTLVVKGHADSSASRFAAAEGFTFKLLPNAANEDPVTIPTAGSYTLTFSINVTNIADKQDNIQESYYDITYVTDNGNGTTMDGSNRRHYDLKSNWTTVGLNSNGTHTFTVSVPGWPTKVDSFHDAVWKDKIHYSVTGISVNGTSTWSGSTDVHSGGVGNSTDSDSFTLTATEPTPTKIDGSMSGDSTAQVNTDGTDYRSNAYTYGKVKDQYGVIMAKNPTITVSSSLGGTTGISFDKDFGRLVLKPTANRANDYTVTIKQTAGSSSNTKSVTVTTFDYNVIFSYTEGTRRKTVTETVNFGSKPTDPRTWTEDPIETPVKYDSDGHQTFSSWSNEINTYYRSGPQDVTVEAQYNDFAPHTYDGEPVEAKAATCTDPQILKVPCSECGYDKLSEGEPALGHTGDTTPRIITPIDGKPGVTYYRCTRCNTCWGAVYNNGVFSKDTENEQESIEGEPNLSSVIENTSSANVLAPAPAFNLFTDPSLNNYDYSMRGGSLKVSGSAVSLANSANDETLLTTTTQGMRFTASMHIPEGVALANTGSGNRLTDFGYVWSQTALIGLNGEDSTNISNLEQGKTNVYQTSVVSNNSKNGTFTGNNWTGVSAHDDNLSEGGKTLTFNLVVNVKAKNWKKAYCARAYIKYIYNGVEYTVYDQSYSSRSVEYIATAVVGSPYESQRIKNYFQTKVYNNLQYVPE